MLWLGSSSDSRAYAIRCLNGRAVDSFDGDAGRECSLNTERSPTGVVNGTRTESVTGPASNG
eukprot:4687197-Alexandrium_andersonii.AAC.1